MRSSPLVLLTMCGLNLAFGQQKPSAPQPEDPELYFAFFRAHSAVDQQMQASAAAVAATLAASTASLYQISPTDLPKLTTEARTFMSDLAAWESPLRTYVAQQQAAVAQAELDYINSVFAHNVAKLSLARAAGAAAENLSRYLRLP